jgi:hypothetical protein
MTPYRHFKMTITLWTDFHLASTVKICSEFFVSFSSSITRKMFFSLGYTTTVFSARQHQQHTQHNATPASPSKWDARLSFGRRRPHRGVGRPKDCQVRPLFPSSAIHYSSEVVSWSPITTLIENDHGDRVPTVSTHHIFWPPVIVGSSGDRTM